jgi:hypothetical protein
MQAHAQFHPQAYFVVDTTGSTLFFFLHYIEVVASADFFNLAVMERREK